jgi:hypothetical protein
MFNFTMSGIPTEVVEVKYALVRGWLFMDTSSLDCLDVIRRGKI